MDPEEHSDEEENVSVLGSEGMYGYFPRHRGATQLLNLYAKNGKTAIVWVGLPKS